MIIFVRIESLDHSFRIFHNPALTVRRNNGTWTRFVQETKKIHQKRNNRGAHVRNLRSHTWSWLIRSRATAFLGLLHLSSAPQYIFDSQRCNDGSRSCVAVPRIILPASLSHVWYILSLSLSLPSFRERNPDVGLRSGRFVKATVPRPQIHDHSNVSRCQSSCINIIRWPSFNYAAWRFAVHQGLYSLPFDSIRILSDTVHSARLIGSRWICILRDVHFARYIYI